MANNGKVGFAVGNGRRQQGVWKKERSARGRLEILLNDVTYGQLLDLFERLDNGEFDKNAKVGDVLDIAVLKEIFVKGAPGEKIKVSLKKLLQLYDFIYGKKAESNVTVDADIRTTSIKGFVLPITNADFIDEKGHQIKQIENNDVKQLEAPKQQ